MFSLIGEAIQIHSLIIIGATQAMLTPILVGELLGIQIVISTGMTMGTI
jgi:hypothetical protein